MDLRFNVRGLGRVDIGLSEFEAVSLVRSHTLRPRKELRRVGTFRQKFHPFVAPLADEAFVLHFTGELKPWRLSASYAEQRTTHGAALTPTGHAAGGCELDQRSSRASWTGASIAGSARPAATRASRASTRTTPSSSGLPRAVPALRRGPRRRGVRVALAARVRPRRRASHL